MKRGKNYRTARQQVDKNIEMNIGEALQNLDSFPKAKFDETIDCAVRLNVNPRHADQMVRGTVVLPNGTGKTVRVAVFAQGANADAAKEAGADIVGMEDLAEQSIDELLEIEGMDEERAGALIMTARAPWFAESAE